MLKQQELTEGLPQGALKEHNAGLLKASFQALFITGAEGLQQIERRIDSLLDCDAPVLSEISRYLLTLGGKRIRPLLTVLSARLFGCVNPTSQLVDAAAGIELIHMATLLHDDIIDESPTRRSKPSAFVRYGTHQTLLAGDFLLVKAFGLCSKLDPYVVEATERACIELTEGEVLEGKLDRNRQLNLDEYVQIVAKKTASLFALSSAVGAQLAGATQVNRDRLFEFGMNAGIAFQMIDDILDVTADEDLLGKPAGTDLKQKTPSLVNILWLASGDPAAEKFFSTPASRPEAASDSAAGSEEWRHALELLRRSPIIEQAREVAVRYATLANSALHRAEAPELDFEVREQLAALVEYTLERCL